MTPGHVAARRSTTSNETNGRSAISVSTCASGRGALSLDTDYVRGRMMKTRVMVWPTGVVEIETTNRHQMATRWIETLKGKKHLRLVSGDAPLAP